MWVDRGGGVERVACEVGGAPEVRQLAVRLAGLAGRRLDDSTPYVDGLLPPEATDIYQKTLAALQSQAPTVSFEELKAVAFPALLRAKEPGAPLRAWVVGCSTGEGSGGRCSAPAGAGRAGCPWRPG